MIKSIGFRWLVIGVVLLVSALQLIPSIQFFSMSAEDKEQMKTDEPETLQELTDQSLNLGLDLQGGMHVVLEVDLPVLVENLADHKAEELSEAVAEARKTALDANRDFWEEFERASNRMDLRLIRYFSTMEGLRGKSNTDVISVLKEEGENATSSALEIIRNRVDEFGVSEPNIQKSGHDRIVVELAGIEDPERARNLIQRTALLEFTLVKTNDDLSGMIEKLDNALLAAEGPAEEPADSVNTEPADDSDLVIEEDALTADSTDADELDDLFDTFEEDSETSLLKTTDDILIDKPFSGYLRSFPGGMGVLAGDIPAFTKLLNSEAVQNVIPGDAVFLWGSKVLEGATQEGTSIAFQNLYYVSSEAVLTGGVVTDARAAFGGVGTDQTGKAVVNLAMDSEGSKDWARFTGANIGRNVAIVLDKKVYMAPNIRDRIPGGRTQISGLDNIDEAMDIANVLRAGKLPAPVVIVEEHTVGPSLGEDSIIAGSKAMLYGFIAIIIFMAIYYQGSGLLANLSLILNLFIVIGVLAMLKATLTLPGIAGLILTIGMAVDANVIIFERIREELNKGKTVRASIEAGYSRAFTTILDANITTLIAAFVLAWNGSGPIKGFAVTLSVGIISSMFTAVFITRTIFMMFGNKKPLKSLSIG